MVKCWIGNALNSTNCDRQSREHGFLPNAILESWQDISVQGLDWCPTSKVVSAQSLTMKCLCRYHNTATSFADRSFNQFWDSVGEFVKFHEARSEVVNCICKKYVEKPNRLRIKLRQLWWRLDAMSPIKVLVSDIKNVERWIAKHMCNMIYSKQYKIKTQNSWAIPKALVAFVMGTQDLKPGCGLYLVAEVGDKLQLAEQRLSSEGAFGTPADVLGICFSIRGLRFVFSWKKTPEELRAQGFQFPQVVKPKCISLECVISTGVSMRLDW